MATKPSINPPWAEEASGRPARRSEGPRWLAAAETAAVLPYAQLVPAIAQAARELASGKLVAPERTVVPIGEASTLLCMPAVAADLGIAKLVTVHPANPARGLPSIQGEVVVFEAATGRRLLMLDGPTLTARRTAAVTLLGLRLLGPKAPRSAILIGTGVQAAAHAEALVEAAEITEFCVAGMDLAQAEAFTDRLAASHPGVRAVGVRMADLTGAAMERFDVVIALTTATSPVVPAAVADRTLVVGVGAYRPDMAEIPPELIHRRQVVVDFAHGAQQEAGDLLQAGVHWPAVRELFEVLDAPPEPYAPTIFKTVGHSSWDLAAARVAAGNLGLLVPGAS